MSSKFAYYVYLADNVYYCRFWAGMDDAGIFGTYYYAAVGYGIPTGAVGRTFLATFRVTLIMILLSYLGTGHFLFDKSSQTVCPE